MKTCRSARTRVVPGLALLALAVGGCSESDLEELHAERLDDAIAAENVAEKTPDNAAPDLGGATPPESGDGPHGLDPDGYTLVFSDEFGGLSLDASSWNTALPWGPDITTNDESQYYVDELGSDETEAGRVDRSPFSFDGEALAITATEVGDVPDTSEGRRAAANGLTWLSGVLTTAEKFDFTYGHAEARVDLPPGQGLWPSIWMLGAEPIGLRPQLYVMEHDGGRPDSIFHNYEYVDAEGDLRSPGQFEIVEDGLSEGFHTIGLSWSPTEFLFFLDGVPRYRIAGDDIPSQDMYLAFPFAIGGTWTGEPDASTPSPATWTIDYVRVWQKRDPG